MSFKYTGEARKAIVESIKHWEAIQRLVEDSSGKLGELGEMLENDYIGANTCALCQYDDSDCTHCPLAIEGNQCNCSDSPYATVLLSVDIDDETTTAAIAKMVEVLEALLELTEAELKSEK